MDALEKALYDYHNTTKTIVEILNETGLSKSYFYRHLDYKEDFRAKKKARKYTFNFDKFQNLSRATCYWLGFLSADGAVVKNTLAIELKEIDKEHLEKFNKYFNNEAPINIRVNNNGVSCAKTQINSFELVEFLKNFNIVQNKSKIFTMPLNKIPSEYHLDFARGMIDGDGCIRINNHQQISLEFCSGNKECVEQMKQILHLENKITQDKNTFHVQVTGNKKAKAILDTLYENSTYDTRLNRKYNIYKTLN